MSMISTAVSGLAAAQRGLEATSNNVANAGTEGYVRRRITQVEAVTAGAGVAADLGSGVRVIGVERMYDAFLTDALRGAMSSEQRSLAVAELATRLDGLLGNPELGIAASIQSFFDDAELLGRDPTSAASRQQLLLQGEALAQRFRQLSSQLTGLSDEVDRRLEDSVTRVNAIAASLAKINESIGRGASSANDLLDQRDALLTELTARIDASVVRQEDGTVTVMVGNGQALVLGNRSAALGVTPDAFDPSRLQLTIELGAQSVPISRQVGGGTIGGLLAFRGEALDPARRELGLIAVSLASAFNAQNAMGVDADGNLGGDFFASLSPQVGYSSANAGAATLAASFADISALKARDYELRFDGGAWSLADAVTGQPVTMTGAGTAADPFVFEGIAVAVSGAAAAGDRFQVRPVGDAAGRFAVALGDPAGIAAASPVRTARNLANLSDATIALAGIADVTDPALRAPAELRFESATTFRIYDGVGTDLSGPLTYTSGADVTFNGWTVRVTGTAAAGDRFDVLPTGAGSADNGNALALAQAGSRGLLSGGQVSVDDIAARLVSTVGAAALRGQQAAGVQAALRERAELDIQSASGVNLDEEASNLLRYQQAYQAASKIIAIADDLFQSLLGILR
jgi:flagellar hook-associated protein 1 FlgK